MPVPVIAGAAAGGAAGGAAAGGLGLKALGLKALGLGGATAGGLSLKALGAKLLALLGSPIFGNTLFLLMLALPLIEALRGSSGSGSGSGLGLGLGGGGGGTGSGGIPDPVDQIRKMDMDAILKTRTGLMEQEAINKLLSRLQPSRMDAVQMAPGISTSNPMWSDHMVSSYLEGESLLDLARAIHRSKLEEARALSRYAGSPYYRAMMVNPGS